MKELAIDSTGAWKWNIPLKTSADGNIATYTFTPNTYANYFAFIGGQTTLYNIKVHSSSTGAYTSSSGGVVGSVRERLYAYYKLPDELVSLGATIEISANLDSAVKFTNMKVTHKFISVAGNISKSKKRR